MNNNIIINSKYAPGLATYGANGKQGKVGPAGYSLYFIPFDIDDLSEPSDDNQYNQLLNCILNNKYITNNSYISVELLVMKDRTYQLNDLFLIPSGKIYKLTDINALTKEIAFEKVGSLVNDNLVFRIVDNVIINTDNMPVVIADNVQDVNNIDSLLTIYYDKNNQNKNILSLIDVNGTNKLNLKSADNNGLLFDSSNPTYFNNIYVKYDSDAPSNYGSYFKVAFIDESGDESAENFYTYNGTFLTINRQSIKTVCEVICLKNDKDDSRYIREVQVVTPVSPENNESEISIVCDEFYSVELGISMGSYVSKYIKIK